jgi:hypothetical protein
MNSEVNIILNCALIEYGCIYFGANYYMVKFSELFGKLLKGTVFYNPILFFTGEGNTRLDVLCKRYKVSKKYPSLCKNSMTKEYIAFFG